MPFEESVETCVKDILSAIEETESKEIFVQGNSIGPPTAETVEIYYRVLSKYRELSASSEAEILCEYCGDSWEHILQVRGGGGEWGASDEICVTWEGGSNGGGSIMTYFSCVSCCNSLEDVDLILRGFGRQMKETCIGCGIHTSVTGGADITGLNPVSLCLQESNRVVRSEYYLCEYCLSENSGKLEELVIERIKRLREFYEYEGNDIQKPGDFHLPSPQIDSIEDCEENEEISNFSALFSESDEELTSDEELNDTYYGEYENEELPENNTEKVAEIKGAIREVGEKMFDLQEQLKEGDYLEIMNLLQKVTNKVNSL